MMYVQNGSILAGNSLDFIYIIPRNNKYSFMIIQKCSLFTVWGRFFSSIMIHSVVFLQYQRDCSQSAKSFVTRSSPHCYNDGHLMVVRWWLWDGYNDGGCVMVTMMVTMMVVV